MNVSKTKGWCICLIMAFLVTYMGCDSKDDSHTNTPQNEEATESKAKKTGNTQANDLWQAVLSGDVSSVTSLCHKGIDVNIKDKSGMTPLHRAANRAGYDDIVLILIDNGAEVNEGDDRGWRPLHMAAMKGHIDIVKLLVSKGAEINVRDQNGDTPMKWAAITKKNPSVVEFLKAHGGVE